MTLTATSRIEGIALLQHHDLVTVPPERTESATASERYAARHLTETAISGQAPNVQPREPASTRRVQRPREPARYAPSEGVRKTRRRAASDGRPENGRRHAT